MSEREQILQELRAADKLLLTTHENPDGDALGSLLAMHEILRLMGKDSVMFMAADQLPLPPEYRDMPFAELLHQPPADAEERVVVFLDCGNIDRMPVAFLTQEGMRILNIDHHHDNTLFGTVNLVDPSASCTAEIVLELAKELEVELTSSIADALYVGLVTDTGRFSFQNTTPRAHRMAAELIDAGVVPDEVYRRLYENRPPGRMLLLGRALAGLRRYDEGMLTLGHLSQEDFLETGASQADTEGIMDELRKVEGTAVAALVRELDSHQRDGRRKVSLRATDGRVDVSAIARGLGGGGHRQAAGCTTELPLPELIERLRVEVLRQL